MKTKTKSLMDQWIEEYNKKTCECGHLKSNHYFGWRHCDKCDCLTFEEEEAEEDTWYPDWWEL